MAGNSAERGAEGHRHSRDRRGFLAGSVAAVATAAAATVAARWSPAAGAEASSARVLVDWHSHFVSNAEMKFFASRQQAPRLLTGPDGVTRLENVDTASAAAGRPAEFSASDIPARIRHLDKNGIQRQLLTARPYDGVIDEDIARTRIGACTALDIDVAAGKFA